MSSSAFDNSDSHGSTLEKSRPSINAQFLDNKSRSLSMPRNSISRTRSELSASLLRDFSHHAPVHMSQFLRRFHPSNNARVRMPDRRKPSVVSISADYKSDGYNNTVFEIRLIRYLHICLIFFLLCKFIIYFLLVLFFSFILVSHLDAV